MAVFSNDPRAQGLWSRVQMLTLITKNPCPDTREQRTDLCLGDNEKRARLGYAGCIKVEIVKNDCQDYKRNVIALAATNAELTKYLNDTAKAKADAENKAADLAAEQAIIARRRAADKSLSDAYNSACRPYLINQQGFQIPGGNPNYNAKTCADLDKQRIATNNFTSGSANVTFDEIARERGQSAATGARAAPGVARALARPARTPRARLPRPKPQPRVPKKPVLRAKRVSSAQSA
jgi:hypothetical protein